MNTFNASQQEGNAFAKTLGMADAALSAHDAVSAAERVQLDLNVQLRCALHNAL